MISEAVFQALKGYVPEENIRLQEPMAGHTTFRIGGPADCFLQPENEKQLIQVLNYLKKVEMPYFILGKGSNLLVSDEGFRGVVIQIGAGMSRIAVAGNKISAQAGATMAQVARAAWEHGLTGLEFAAGIPGTVGGGVVMNAGAYDGEMSYVVEQVSMVNGEGEIFKLGKEDLEFGYRTSVIKNKPFIVTDVVFCLQKGNREAIKTKMDELAAKRREKQPLEYPSAGSTFKRPEGLYAGKLIMDAGLRGYRVGGAQVSEKHCGFVINTGQATAKDVMELITEVRKQVKDKFKVDLEPEILYLS